MAGLNRPVQPADLPQGRVKVELSKVIEKLNLDKTPLLKLSQHVSKVGVGDMKFNWLTDERVSDWGTISAVGGAWAAAAATGGTITVPVDEAWRYAEGDILQIPYDAASPQIKVSDNTIYVEGVVYTTGVITAHTYDNTSLINLTGITLGADILLYLSNTFELGTGKGTSKSYQPTPDFNFIQIVQHPYEVVETTMHTTMDAGGEELSEQEEKALIAHEFSKEKLMFFGRKAQVDAGYMTGVYRQYFTGGLVEAISTNAVVVAGAGALTQLEFGNWVNQSIYYAENPVIFASGMVFEGLSYWLGTTLTTEQSENTLGIAVSTYLTQYGNKVPIIPHRELLQKGYGSYAFCVDLKDIGYRYLNGEDTHLEVGLQANDAKLQTNEYRTWFGFYVGNEKRHGMLRNVLSIT